MVGKYTFSPVWGKQDTKGGFCELDWITEVLDELIVGGNYQMSGKIEFGNFI